MINSSLILSEKNIISDESKKNALENFDCCKCTLYSQSSYLLFLGMHNIDNKYIFFFWQHHDFVC